MKSIRKDGIVVAKSYQELEIIGDVFVSSGRQYVNVKLKSGKLKTVRWYTDSEYRKMYPDAEPAATRSDDPYYKPQKEVLGFTKGYITIFKGNAEEENEWFRLSSARYAKFWGWYFISTEDLPPDLPEDVTPVRLNWDLVGNADGKLKSDAQVVSAVESVLYSDSNSEYVGEVGERLELYLTVDKTIQLEGQFTSTMHIMHDDCGNSFVWVTSAKSWPAGSEHHIRGTVKEHKVFKGEKQTWLTRCLEAK